MPAQREDRDRSALLVIGRVVTENAKISTSHLARQAIVYLRQSSPSQVEHNRESTDRQYALAIKARELGWSDDRIVILDEDGSGPTWFAIPSS
jgi:hypothetical protein